jgi:hypothetical protein
VTSRKIVSYGRVVDDSCDADADAHIFARSHVEACRLGIDSYDRAGVVIQDL